MTHNEPLPATMTSRLIEIIVCCWLEPLIEQPMYVHVRLSFPVILSVNGEFINEGLTNTTNTVWLEHARGYYWLCGFITGRESEDLVATGTNPLQPTNSSNSPAAANGAATGARRGGGAGASSNNIQSSQSSGALTQMTSQSQPHRKLSNSRVSSNNVLAPAGSIRSRDLSKLSGVFAPFWCMVLLVHCLIQKLRILY